MALINQDVVKMHMSESQMLYSTHHIEAPVIRRDICQAEWSYKATCCGVIQRKVLNL